MMKSLPSSSPGGLPADENPTVDENDPAGQISALTSLHHQQHQQQQQQHFRHHMPSFASSQCFDSKPEPESVPQQQPDFLQPAEPSAASSEEGAPMFCAQQQQQPMLPICAQCAQPIADPYILRMHPDLEFHPGCLKCAECERLLDETAGSAFVRDGKILCRDDYIRLYSYRRCQRCDMQVQPSDFVMRARQLVFHRNCFTCIVCNHLLMPGEQFLLHRDELCCRPQCLMQSQGFAALPPQFVPLHLQPAPAAFPSSADKSGTGGTAQFELAQLMGGTTTTKSDQGPPSHQRQNSMPNASSSATGFQRAQPPGCPSAVSSGASPLSFSNPDESMTPDSTNASTPTTNGGNLGGHFPGGSGHQSFEAAMAAGMVYSSGGAMGGAVNGQQGGSNCSSSSGSLMVVAPKYAAKKSKKEKSAQRVRTVLNESQLKMLRQAYNQNQRPDTGTKEQLVEMTGLNARVIRVWFQNKRCKDKKRQLEHREKMQNQEKEHALRGVRLSGIGPLTAASPGPMDQQHSQIGGSGSHHQQHQQQFPTAVEIHQLTQNHASLFCRNDDGKMAVPMEEGGQNNNHLFQHANGTAMTMLSMSFQVPNGVPPEFMNLNPAVML